MDVGHLNACYCNSAEGRGTFGDYGSDLFSTPLKMAFNLTRPEGVQTRLEDGETCLNFENHEKEKRRETKSERALGKE